MSSRLPALAMLLGGAVALLEVGFGDVLVRTRAVAVPEDAVAVVDGITIPRSDYERAAAALEADLGRPLDADEREHVTARLVDELLLVEHGLALELPQRDPFLRTQIARALIDRVQADIELAAPPSEAELLAHYDAHASLFGASAHVRLRGLWFTDVSRAQAAAARWTAGEVSFEHLRERADPPPFDLPSSPLSHTKLRDYIGPSNVERVATLAIGQVATLQAEGGAWVVMLTERSATEPPPFAQVRAQVERDLLRARTDAALEQLLAELRAGAEIEVSQP